MESLKLIFRVRFSFLTDGLFGCSCEQAVCKEYNEKFEAALSEERAARELLKSKFQEIDSVQSVINRVKNALSVKDIDCRVSADFRALLVSS